MEIKEEYNKKYAELSLTGNIPQNPKYTYEYDLPKDFDEAIKVISALDNSEVEYEICLNRNDELVLNTDLTPAYLCYRPKQDTEEVVKDSAEEFKLRTIPQTVRYSSNFDFSDIHTEILERLAELDENDIAPKAIIVSSKTYNELICSCLGQIEILYGLPIYRNKQVKDFLIGV